MREVTKENWNEVLGAGTVLMDVWGPGCAPCIAMMPQVEKLAEELKVREVRKVEVVKLDSSKNRRLCIEHRIMGMPAFLLFHDGKEVSRIGGNDLKFGEMKEWLEGHLRTLNPSEPS